MQNVTLMRIRETTVAVEKQYVLYISLCVGKQVRACAFARAYVRICGCPGAWACPCAYARVILIIQHASRMCLSVSSFVASLATPYFSTLSHKRHDLCKMLLNIKHVF